MKGWRRLRGRTDRNRESARDIQFYLDTETQDNIDRGMSPEDARAAARRKFGNPTFIHEEIYHMGGIHLLETISLDVLYAWRTLRKNPAFALTAVVTLGLGIGANTAIFSVIRTVLLKPLEYADPSRLVRLSGGATTVRFEEMTQGARSFSGIGTFRGVTNDVTLVSAGGPEVLKSARVSANYLTILGLPPVVGRSFRVEEDTPGGAPVAMISSELWQRRFGGNPSMVGHTAILGATPYTVIGVLPKGFAFPFSGVDVWMTKPWEGVKPQSPVLSIFGRLRPDVSLAQASAELTVLRQQYNANHPGMLDGKSKGVEQAVPWKDDLVARVRAMLWMLFGAVGFVLLIACANVASLLLARAASRSREFAIRAALGAGRGRIMGQLLAESVLLGSAGGLVGLLLARWSLNGLTHLTALDLPRAGEIRLDGMVLAFAMGISVVTGMVFGLIPSLTASRPDLAEVLRASSEAARRTGLARIVPGFGMRGTLVAGQVALSVVLLIGAALLMESLDKLSKVDPGFQAGHLLTMSIALPPARYDTDQKRTAFVTDLVSRTEAMPGVRNAAVTWSLPMTGWAGSPVQAADQPPALLNQRPIAILEFITPAYFRTLGIGLRRGREFTEHDTATSKPVAIIDEALARRVWPAYPSGADPVGQLILIGISTKPLEVVGVVGSVLEGLSADPRPGVYRPYSQGAQSSVMFAVRTEGDPVRFVQAVRGQVQAIDRDQAISAVKSMEEVVEADEGQRRLVLILLGTFAGTALLLSMVGIYGAIAYSVAQRTRELGIRRALGAQGGDILRLVLGQGLGMALVGSVFGVAGALALTRVMVSFLFHVSPTDPATFVAIAVLLIAIALAASYLPARRATRIDPMAALRMG